MSCSAALFCTVSASHKEVVAVEICDLDTDESEAEECVELYDSVGAHIRSSGQNGVEVVKAEIQYIEHVLGSGTS